jgi:alanine-synthesizing transaminase
VYGKDILAAIARLAEQHGLIVFSDEIYDQILYDGAEHVPMASLVHETLCVTFNGLSKVYRACGYRVGWMIFSGEREHARDYMQCVELLASLRLCASVPGQWAMQTALGGFQSIGQLVSEGGRLFESRKAIIEGVSKSRFLSLCIPKGAIYGFLRVDTGLLPGFNDRLFAMSLLENKHLLIAPGSTFNAPYADHFRITMLPDALQMGLVFTRMEEALESLAA